MANFNLPPDYNEEDEDGNPIPGGRERRLRVKQFTLKKMAEAFRNFKKKLWEKYLKNKKAPPVFKGPLEKLQHQWPGFVAYKESEVAKERSKKRKILRKSNITMLWGQAATGVQCHVIEKTGS